MTDNDPLIWADFDDDVFCVKEKQASVPVHRISYHAKQETDGWFHADNVEKLLEDKQGQNTAKSAIEHDYFHKRYEQALDKAQIYLRVGDTNPTIKAMNMREMAELAAHCAARLDRIDVLESVLDRLQSMTDLGAYLTKGRFYSLCPVRHGDALHALVEYSRCRNQCHTVWADMAEICTPFWPDLALALTWMALRMAGRHLLSRSEKPQPKIQRQQQQLEERYNTLIQQGYDTARYVAWMEGTSNVSNKSFGRSDLDFIFQQWTSMQAQTDDLVQAEEEEEEKMAKDL